MTSGMTGRVADAPDTEVRGPDLTAGPVPSPCMNVCRMDAAGALCEGCLRTLDEIAAWSQLSEPAKRAVWAQLELRRAQPGAARREGAAP